MTRLREIVKELEKRKRCTCDYDKWVPTIATGHTLECVIHMAAVEIFERGNSQEAQP